MKDESERFVVPPYFAPASQREPLWVHDRNQIPQRFNGRTRHSFTEDRLGRTAQKWVRRPFRGPCTVRPLSAHPGTLTVFVTAGFNIGIIITIPGKVVNYPGGKFCPTPLRETDGGEHGASGTVLDVLHKSDSKTLTEYTKILLTAEVSVDTILKCFYCYFVLV